ncbi:Zn-dependent exopeptidase M28 [Acutalibacter sp. 1XD8-33]|uniref:M28 family metallopeptidase n=1 Tax=Acutalibacter sp. 1XD8-33 TaxID=2320081 RepID=UPI000EA3F437|nr:M28 family metallopeptidase [Acutalibacter sp. 1XD8-33]RKJ39949.1 Zn-dependent exopeptidase M28 [Acutalibacter sp. 1XD8-33]
MTMEVSGKRAMELLEKIGFTRTAGSPEELKAAEILKAECEAIGVPAELESFEIEDADIETATLEILEPYRQEYPVTGYKCAKNTYQGGLEAEFLYVEAGNDVDLSNAAGKIVLINGFLRLPLFRKLIKAEVAGIVTMEGDLRDDREGTDLSTRKLRRTLRAFGNVPMVNTRVLDAFDMVKRGASKARLVLKNETVERISHNVVAVIEGTEKPDEIISFGAHYDSVDFSKGVYDNGAGSVINMEVLRWFKENPPKRTVKFMWYGSEEIGLEGSWAFVKAHKDELKDHLLMINTDVGGPVLGRETISVTAEESLVNYIQYSTKVQGYSTEVKQGIYSSDSIPFADSGVPAVNFCRFGAPGAAHIHNRFDTLSFLSPEALEKTARYVLAFSRDMVNATAFPVKREVPQNMVEEVEKYLYKKELAEAEENK